MSCHYAELHHEALLHIKGPDTLKFLQGQTTCDTRPINASRATLGAYCTPKGRVVCDFLLSQISTDHFALRMRKDILGSSGAVFGKYILFSKAELDTQNTDWRLFACWGDDAASTLQSLLKNRGIEGNTAYGSLSGDGYVLIQTDSPGTQFECYINQCTHPELLTKLSAEMAVCAEGSWQASQIEQGIARIEAATVELFVPQMLNYDLSGHISFDKGCYTGQEVVARLHYRGKPKKRLFLTEVPKGITPAAGCALYADRADQSAATLVNAAPSANGKNLALIVAPVDGMTSGLHLGDPNGPVLNYDSTG